jgi:hypothetical protein
MPGRDGWSFRECAAGALVWYFLGGLLGPALSGGLDLRFATDMYSASPLSITITSPPGLMCGLAEQMQAGVLLVLERARRPSSFTETESSQPCRSVTC